MPGAYHGYGRLRGGRSGDCRSSGSAANVQVTEVTRVPELVAGTSTRGKSGSERKLATDSVGREAKEGGSGLWRYGHWGGWPPLLKEFRGQANYLRCGIPELHRARDKLMQAQRWGLHPRYPPTCATACVATHGNLRRMNILSLLPGRGKRFWGTNTSAPERWSHSKLSRTRPADPLHPGRQSTSCWPR